MIYKFTSSSEYTASCPHSLRNADWYTTTDSQSRDVLPVDAGVQWGWWQTNKASISFPQDIARALGITPELSKSLLGVS